MHCNSSPLLSPRYLMREVRGKSKPAANLPSHRISSWPVGSAGKRLGERFCQQESRDCCNETLVCTLCASTPATHFPSCLPLFSCVFATCILDVSPARTSAHLSCHHSTSRFPSGEAVRRKPWDPAGTGFECRPSSNAFARNRKRDYRICSNSDLQKKNSLLVALQRHGLIEWR
ncbi:hypothetical protein B0T10DRAFT_227774 [Thelonectria olida]|uniref:Uncharacterized protein n=1 Tax=Thelonectria olida TaxID=1576542 RepID=A0A9P9ATG8_9HYPO|nr:hypothetical protein B0T10DRAFT_227774 [Thelonectria olida]